jgi:hypothetical protein
MSDMTDQIRLSDISRSVRVYVDIGMCYVQPWLLHLYVCAVYVLCIGNYCVLDIQSLCMCTVYVLHSRYCYTLYVYCVYVQYTPLCM